VTRADEPLDLGVVGDGDGVVGEPPPSRATGHGGPWRWVALAAAVAVGVLLGVVVSGARHDAAELNEVGVVLGGVTGMSGPGEPAAASVQLLNVGEREIEILGFGADGLSIAPGSPDPEPVTAPPGEWVTVEQQGLVPDCAAEPPERLDVVIRDAAGEERVVRSRELPDSGLSDQLWWSCMDGPQISFLEPEVVTAGPASVVMNVAVFNDGTDEVTLHELGADSPGLRAEPAGLPVIVPPGQAAAATLTWTVDDCAMAGQFFDVNLTWSLAEGADRRDNPPGYEILTGPARAELVRLVDRACESEG
jgi:hypothetical protein